MPDMTGPWWGVFLAGLFFLYMWVGSTVQGWIRELRKLREDLNYMRERLERLEHDAKNRTR